MRKLGTFKIETSFNITGRGIVALGQLIDGLVKLRSITNIEFDGKTIPAQVSGYDMPNLGEDNIMRCGIYLSFDDSSLTKRIAIEKLKEQIIEIYEE